MISKEIITGLMPKLQEVIPKEDWDTLPLFFKKIYKLQYTDYIGYALAIWGDELPAVIFNVDTYEYMGVVTQEYAIEHGEVI